MKDISQIKWHFWHIRKRTPLLLYFMFYGPTIISVDGLSTMNKSTGSVMSHIVTKKEELDAYSKKLWELFQEKNDFIYNEMLHAYKKNEEDRNKWKKLLDTDFTTKTNAELSKIYEQYIKDVLAYSAYIWFPLGIESYLTEEVKNVLGKDKEMWYDVVMTPVRESDSVRERKELLKIAIDHSKEALQEHIEEFSFLKKKGMFMEFFDQTYYQKQIQKCNNPQQELKTLDKESRHKHEQFNNLLEAYKDNTYAQWLFKTTNEAVFFRTWRTERIIQSSFYIVLLCKEIAKRLNIQNEKEVLWLLPSEVTKALELESIDKSTIQERKQAFVFLPCEGETIVAQGNDAKAIFKQLDIFEEQDEDIKGTPAFKGKAKGVVTLVESVDDYPRIKNAEILVTHATVPDMVPYFTNIKAIVTEEGGILSHAAIISREMKIPSVIGTKIATKVLKDGDVVEVDAENGTVKKL